MHILLTGGTGLIGRQLIPRLLQRGDHVSVVTRDVANARLKLGDRVNVWSDLKRHDLDGIDAVINLAGEPIADKRWSEQQKQRLCESRWQITEQLATLINASRSPPSVFISGSATGYYGDRGEQLLTEDDTSSDEFTHRLCARWEALALMAENEKTRVCLLRTGLVLAKEGGALHKMKRPFKLGIGGPMGSGKQYLPWIHLDDMLNAILWLLENKHLYGPFNLVAPGAVRNEQFAAMLGHVLHRPAFMRTPAAVIKLMMGESAVLVLSGQHLLPTRLVESGFSFRWAQLGQALEDVV
ncbi:TIGR01777 family protein [Erwinia endophytica]|uniref:TIGR01777 family oxidoreductase n=1 Tax=Erwinia endophytica TaxID=1563158 RepID=UPI001265F919|nr:TIGR01777 family oxidoreductase [Erwinia endophytica]KAB8312197.1 TIGR01777 family protein [Erwinia endophytica]